MSSDLSDMPKRQGTSAIPFARILSGEMKKRGLSIQQIADLAGVSKSVAQGWTTGANPHDLQAVHRLAVALAMDFQALLLGVRSDARTVAVEELYDEHDLFDGLCKVSIKKLVPKK